MPNKRTINVVIIGSGIAGNTAIMTMRQGNSKARLTLISEEIHPLYSACALPYYLAGSISRDGVFIKGHENYTEKGTKYIVGEKAEDIDTNNKKIFLSSKKLPYDKLVIATGGEVIIPPIKGIDKEGVFTFKSLSDADSVYGWDGKKAVVIGSGLIGIEVAIALKERGYQVSIIELLDWILPRVFDSQPALLLIELLEKNGIKIYLKERVNSIIGTTRITGIVTDKREIECDTVILATGIRPNVELARKAGLKIGELGGIEVDSLMQSSLGDIYACGDCVESTDVVSGEKALNLLWHNAKQQADVAAHNCLGDNKQYHGSMNITGVDVFGTKAISLGITSTNISSGKTGKLEVVEKNWDKDYLRLVIHDNYLIGIQSVSRMKDLGFLLGALLRKDELRTYEEAHGRLFPYAWWRHKIAEYCER